MIQQEVEERLQQAIQLMKTLIGSPTAKDIETAVNFINENDDKELPPIGYDGSFLDGDETKLPF